MKILQKQIYFIPIILSLICCNTTTKNKTKNILGHPVYYKNESLNTHLKLGLNIDDKKDISIEYSPFGKPSGKENISTSSKYQELSFLKLLNAARKQKGISELSLNQDLSRAARYHSYDMGKQNYFEHDSYDRDQVSTQLIKVCGTFERIFKFGPNFGGCGENIAAGNFSAEATYNQWFNSPGHYKNMFNPKYKNIGIGYVKIDGSDFVHYWTTDFAN
jgi:uncharacterized protein YkwD